MTVSLIVAGVLVAVSLTAAIVCVVRTQILCRKALDAHTEAIAQLIAADSAHTKAINALLSTNASQAEINSVLLKTKVSTRRLSV